MQVLSTVASSLCWQPDPMTGDRAKTSLRGRRPAASARGRPPEHACRHRGECGWSERLAAPVARLAKLDDAVSFVDAATLGLAGRTACGRRGSPGLCWGARSSFSEPAAGWDTWSSS